MNILVINIGSSSIKYSLFESNSQQLISHDLIEENSIDAFNVMYKKLNTLDVTIDAVGHRVVHGGEKFSSPTILTDKVVLEIETLNSLAPLHNPLNILGIKSAKKAFKDAVHIAVFDTAYHQTIPEFAYRYALPHELYETYHLRKYGFHGSSHHFLALESAKILKKPIENINLITIHLGNGSSMCAIKNGKSIDTTMGFTPLDGLIMGTRSGSIDPSIPLFLMKNMHVTPQEIDTLLNKQSGLKAIAGVSDMRTILELCEEKNSNALLAVDMFVYTIKKNIGAYVAILQEVDAIVFSGGIGEHSTLIRKKICNALEHFNIISLVISTNEELHIANQVQKKLNQSI